MASAEHRQWVSDRWLLSLFLLLLALALLASDWLWRWDQLIYDSQLRLWSRPSADNIVIVAIDEASLEEYGRWPWARGIHARLIEAIEKDNPRAIAFDIIFAEHNQNDPFGDQQLVDAVAASGRVYLPILMEQPRAHGYARETLPFPALAQAAAGMGHAHVELDPDGIARSVYLREGLGEAFWPHLSEAMLGANLSSSDASTSAMRHWVRDQRILIPFAGPPGHYKRISYAQVLTDYLPGTFTDKYVLVGTTATGIGDSLPTPVSGFSHDMPGVELNANVLDALQREIEIRPIAPHWRWLITLVGALSPVVVLYYLAPRNALLSVALLFVLVLLFCGLLLWQRHVWFPPVDVLLPILVSYPLWSWRRLERAVHYLNTELDELHRQRSELAIEADRSLEQSIAFLRQLLPLGDWRLTQGEAVPSQLPGGSEWYFQSDRLWRALHVDGQRQVLAVQWKGAVPPSQQDLDILNRFADYYRAPLEPSRASHEALERRITQIQTATRQLRELRKFVDNSLSNMSDGVLVVDAMGQVLLSNARAGWYLQENDEAQLSGQSLFDLLADLQLQDGRRWQELIRGALVDHARIQATVRHVSGRDLLVQMSPLSRDIESMDGMVVNFSDISPLKASERKRTELLNFLSHDIRSPLVSVLALYELMREKYPDAELAQLIDRMQGYTQKTLNLSEQFLQLARAESADEYPFHDVEMVAVMVNAAEQLWAQAQQKNIRIKEEYALDEAWVYGEASLLERALVNLLTNAIKYSPEGTVIRASVAVQDGRCVACVQDEGYGIPEAEIPTLFDRFRRVKTDKHNETGAGLGLAFVHAVVKRHGGEVAVESEEGKGSLFCIRLPVIEIDD